MPQGLLAAMRSDQFSQPVQDCTDRTNRYHGSRMAALSPPPQPGTPLSASSRLTQGMPTPPAATQGGVQLVMRGQTNREEMRAMALKDISFANRGRAAWVVAAVVLLLAAGGWMLSRATNGPALALQVIP